MARTPRTKISLVLALAIATPACDPGWHYQATHGTAVRDDGVRFDVPSPKGLAVRAYASAFTSSLRVGLTLKNVGAKPIELVSPRLAVLDARSVALPLRFVHTRETCHLSANALHLPSGQACTLSTTFEIVPLVPGILLPRDNPDLERITVKLQSDEPKPFADLEIPMDRT